MCRRETSTAAVSGRFESGRGGRGRSCTLQEFLADGSDQFAEKTVTAKTKASHKFTTKKKKRQGLRDIFRLRLCQSHFTTEILSVCLGVESPLGIMTRFVVDVCDQALS